MFLLQSFSLSGSAHLERCTRSSSDAAGQGVHRAGRSEHHPQLVPGFCINHQGIATLRHLTLTLCHSCLCWRRFMLPLHRGAAQHQPWSHPQAAGCQQVNHARTASSWAGPPSLHTRGLPMHQCHTAVLIQSIPCCCILKQHCELTDTHTTCCTTPNRRLALRSAGSAPSAVLPTAPAL
jgi:hypothetical protein